MSTPQTDPRDGASASQRPTGREWAAIMGWWRASGRWAALTRAWRVSRLARRLSLLNQRCSHRPAAPAAAAGRWERGSILIEAVVLVVVLTFPVVYLIATLSRVQAGAYAASAAAREAGRAFVTSPGGEQADARALAASTLVMQAHGFSANDWTLGMGCDSLPCLAPGGYVTSSTVIRVELPLIPGFMDGIVPTSIQVESTHVEAVEEFRAP